MNIITTQRYVFVLLIVMYCNSIGAITINGQNINKIATPDGCLGCKPETEEHFIGFEMKSGNIEIKSFFFDDQEWAQETLNCINDYKIKNPALRDNFVQSGNSLKFNRFYMTTEAYILLEGRKNINISNSLLCSKKISIVGSEMAFDWCCIDADELIIASNTPQSYCQFIRIIFNKSRSIPAAIHGRIDFTNNEMDGIHSFMIMGAEKVEVYFAPHAFE